MYNTRSNANSNLHWILAKLIKSRDWKGVSQRVQSHHYDVLIQDCYGLNPINIAVQSFNSTKVTELSVNTNRFFTNADTTPRSSDNCRRQ